MNLSNKRHCLWKKIFLFLTIIASLIIGYNEIIKEKDKHNKETIIIEQLKKFDLDNISLEKLKVLDSLDPKTLENGKLELLKHKIVITGIARDNAKDILTTIKHINYLGSFFKDYRVIIFENDSIDGTKMALDIWKNKNLKVKIISKDLKNKKRPNHKFMADIRNNYLDALQAPEYKDFDMVMIIDMDMSYGVDIRGIFDSFSKINKWDALCSNGVSSREGKMYDMFAFRNEEFLFSPKKWHEICSKNDPNDKRTNQCEKGKYLSQGFIYDSLAFKMGWQAIDRLYWLLISPQGQRAYPVNSELVEVNSCFGGLAFYKHKFIKDCRYESIDNDCEHIMFNQCLAKKHNGKMVMNPSQIIRYSQYSY